MKTMLVVMISGLLCIGFAQQPNSPVAALHVNGLGASGPYPVPVGLSSSGGTGVVTLQTNQSSPVPFALAVGRIAVGSMFFGAQSLDLATTGCGFSLVMNGFDPGHPFGAVSVLSPLFTASVWFPSTFSGPVALQACVANPSSLQGFTLTAAADLFSGGPLLTSITPSTGPMGGGTALILNGSNFHCDPPTVLVGGSAATSAVVVSAQQVQCMAPALPAGIHDVTLIQSHGSTTLAGGFIAYAPGPPNPTVTSVVSVSGQNPMPGTDSIDVVFSAPIDASSIDPLVNFRIRNMTLNNSIVPGNVVVQPAAPHVARFTPSPSFGPLGYSIQVSIVGQNTQGLAPILGVPQGSPAQQLPLSLPAGPLAGGTVTNGTLTVNLTSAYCPTCVASTSVVENFASLTGRDASYVPQFNAAAWNAAFDAGFLGGCQISGAALNSFMGNPAGLGTRFQRVLTPTVQFVGTVGGTTNPPGLVAPFDTPLANLGATVNPQGGSHIMHLYEAVDLGAPRNTLELVEYGPVQNFVNQATYPGYVAWAGMTSISGPWNCPWGVSGLSPLYAYNYNVATPQAPDPLNLNPPNNNGSCPMSTVTPPVGSMGGVRVTDPTSFNCGPGFTTYYPFPAFTQPFDYIGSGTGAGNLLFEQNLDPNALNVINLNRYRATANTPARRVLGPPKTYTANCFSGWNVAYAAGCDIYDMRFTFVPLVASARSTFYDTNITSGVPIYEGFYLAPSPSVQSAGTNAVWQIEGANAIVNPSTPSGATTGMLTWFSGTPATGTSNPLVLRNSAQPSAPQLTGRRYFRFLASFRNNAATNTRQRYASFLMAISN